METPDTQGTAQVTAEVTAVGALPLPQPTSWLAQKVRGFRNLVRSLFLGQSGTWSLGRFMAFLFGSFAAGVTVWFMALLTFVVLTDRMEQAAPLASAIATIIVGLVGSPTLAAVLSYFLSKKMSASSTPEQVMAPDLVNATELAASGSPGGI